MFKDNDDRLLVTGGAGYVGAHTVRCLIRNGIDPVRIIVFDNLVYGHRSFLPEGVQFLQGDLTRNEEIESVFATNRVVGVLHFAAYAYVGESMVVPGKYFNNNLHGGINLLESMAQHGCRKIVFSSSCAVYGDHGDQIINENSRLQPVNPYGDSKLMFENMLSWYHRIHQIDSISLRYFNAAGADFDIGERHDPETHLIPLLIQTALGQREAFNLYGNDYGTPDGTCIRDFIHVSDLAEAHLRAFDYLSTRPTCSAVNLGSGIGISVKQLIGRIQELSGFRIQINKTGRRPGDPPVLIAENQKARQMLGWKPRHTMNDILRSAWDWHLLERRRKNQNKDRFRMAG